MNEIAAFKNQAQIFQALLDGKTLKHLNTRNIIKLLNGMLHASIDGGRTYTRTEWHFSTPTDYAIRSEEN